MITFWRVREGTSINRSYYIIIMHKEVQIVADDIYNIRADSAGVRVG